MASTYISDDMPRPILDWHPIATVPDGRRVFLWLENGERGNGELAVGMCFWNDGKVDGFWTWGGPNSGVDCFETPTHWALLGRSPNGEDLA